MLKLIIKGFATIALVIKLDNMFAAGFPDEIKDNAEELNASGRLKMEPDDNSTKAVLKRFYKELKVNYFARQDDKRVSN